MTGVVTSKTTGKFSQEEYFQSIEACKHTTVKIFEFVRKASEQKYKQFI